MFFILTALLLGAGGAWLISRTAFRLGLIDQPDRRSSHSRPTPRAGGIGIWATIAAAGLSGLASPALALSSFLAGALSLCDDLRPLSAKLRLFAQFGLAGAALFFFWHDHPHQMLIWLVPAIFFVAGTANFFNFMDGINGIAGISGLISFALLAYFSSLSGAPAQTMWLCAALAAACLGFLPFNCPRARVFMGDVGSITLGFTFALMVVSLTENWTGFLCMASFLFPFYADTLSTLYIRWRAGEKLSQAHRRHLYQILANELDFPHWFISLCYGIVQFSFGIYMILVWRIGAHLQIASVGAAGLMFVFITVVVRRKASCQGGHT